MRPQRSSAIAISRAVVQRSRRIAREPLGDHAGRTPSRARAHERARRRHAPLEHLDEHHRLVVPLEEPLARERLPEHHRRRVDVGVPRDVRRRGAARAPCTRALPLICPSRVVCSRPAAFATPKSSTRATPSVPTRMFCGDTSRCTMSSGCPCSLLRLVRGVQAVEHAGEDGRRNDPGGCAAPRARSDARQPRERLAVHVLHDEEDLALGRDDVERRHDVRVADARRRGAPRRGTSSRTRDPSRTAGGAA